MDFPKKLKYTKDHEWLSENKDGEVTIGVTEYAIEQLGDIVHIELPEIGDEYEVGDSIGTIESTKTVSDLYTPVNGAIMDANDQILTNLAELNKDPYDEGWLVKVKITDGDLDDLGLLDSDEYEVFVGSIS